MTKQQLIALLADYPDETPVFDGKGFDLKAYHVTSRAYDDWDHSTKSDEGEIPGVGIGIAIGPRF